AADRGDHADREADDQPDGHGARDEQDRDRQTVEDEVAHRLVVDERPLEVEV
ncbi:MAG: hypothetical protein AVDCRST_MAG12-782, partial [uncultured Rubrobacteraceae bacterium]